MQHHPRQFAGDGTVDIFDDGKVGRKEDVEVSLLDLKLVNTVFPTSTGFGGSHMAWSRAQSAADTLFVQRARCTL